jgi:hypothetical protein
MTMRDLKLTKAQEQCLRDQAITADQPGPILRDFRVLLDFVGPQGVEVGGKYNLLPLKFIGELDQLISRPLHLDMKRPQLRSHPYLQGLNLMLRASGLTRVEKAGAKAHLVVAPEMLAQWNQLNTTEQYFNLLEAWLRIGRAEMVGESGRFSGELLFDCLQAWQWLPAEGQKFDLKRPDDAYLFGVGRNFYLLALIDLFGLLEVEQPRRPVSPWSPASVKHVPFGDAMFTLIATRLHPYFGTALPEEEHEDEDNEEGQEDEDEDNEEEQEDEDEGEDEMAPQVPVFGVWQPVFQPYFPEWRENLKLPEPEAREGTFLFRVSLGQVWRLIAMPADATLDDLVTWILRSVNFDSDHLYQFTYRDRLGAEVKAVHPYMDEGPWADLIRIGTLPLEPGEAINLLYDFGDSWRFTVKLERIEPPDVKVKAPRIVERHGKAPEQYPDSGW